MASTFDESEFIDTDYESSRRNLDLGAVTTTTMSAQPSSPVSRPPSREEIEAKVSDAHTKLAELKRAQEQLERERSALEESRRRRAEFQNGREEMLHHLTRGSALLEESVFSARRDAEQMSKTLADLRDMLSKVETLREDSWTQENWNVELTRALTTLENARMEWNSARLKWTVLDGALKMPAPEEKKNEIGLLVNFQGKNFVELCKLGLALTWPVAVAALLGSAILAILVLRR